MKKQQQKTKEEFTKYEKEIDAQVRSMNGKMPTNADMKESTSTGSTVYVHPYMRSDGTKVNGYYRSN